MFVAGWISFFFFLQSGNALNHHTRHERTRYVSGRNQIYGGSFDHNRNYIPFVHYWERPLQVLESSMNVPKKLSSRPLFSWDIPVPISTYTPTKKVSITEKPLQLLRDASSSPEKPDDDVSIVTIPPITIHQTRSDRLNRAKDSVLYDKPYVYKKKKSSNRKKSIEESPRSIRWRQSDAQSSGQFGDSKPQLKRKKKGKKNKKGKTEKEIRKRNKVEKMKNELNDGVNEVNRKVEYLEENSRAKKILKEKQKLVQMMKGPETPEVWSPCEKLDEKCEHRCKEVEGKAVCVCFRGFAPAGTRCVDIDECETNNGSCNGKCINTIGSRKCVCSAGFRLIDGTCADVNECLLRNGHGPCQDRCTNTLGSYFCSCEGLPGTSLSQDMHTCKERDACTQSSTGCSHSCVSVAGRAFCTCPDGLELGDDWKTCHDIDECSNPEDYNVDCPTTCINTIGSYTCTTTNSTANAEENST